MVGCVIRKSGSRNSEFRIQDSGGHIIELWVLGIGWKNVEGLKPEGEGVEMIAVGKMSLCWR